MTVKALQFMREVRGEVAKITWASVNTTRGMTIAVMIFVTLMATYLLLADWAMSSLVQWLLGVN